MHHHYTDSGLDNVYLVNGFITKVTPYGDAVAIEDINGLHKAIGDWLINQPRTLNGKEMRFLRHEMDLSQKAVGSLLGKSEQAVRRWEKGVTKPVDKTADKLLRVIYSLQMHGDIEITDLIKKLADADQADRASCKLEELDGRWRIAA
jgi:putative transcriptional regulator